MRGGEGVGAAVPCAVLLRGVNLGRHNRIAMADLRRVLDGLSGVEVIGAYLQSGNAGVITADPGGLATQVERALVDDLGLGVRVVVRTADQLASVVADNPFPTRAAESPKMLHVAFLEHAADPAVVDAFGVRHGDDEIAIASTGDLYLSYSTSSLETPINKVLTKIDGIATARNWNTVLKMRDMLTA